MIKTKTILIPAEYKPLFTDDWREAGIYGGRYSLKSHTVARYLLIRAREKKTRVACFREFQASIAESSHQLLSELIIKYELTDFEVTNNSILNKVNGSDFIFKGLWNNEQSIKSIEGIDIAWVEEAQTVSEKSIEVLTPTVRKAKSKIIYTYNRLLEEDPVHNRLVLEGRPDTLIINVNYDIALKYEMMPDVILKEIEDDKKNRPGLYKHKWLGEPNNMERKIYKDWNIIDEIPHEARLERVGLDFGYSNDPSSIVEIYKYNSGFILNEKTYQKGLSNKQLADILLTIEGNPIIIADSAEPKSIDEIMGYGVNILPCVKGKDSVSQGIQFVKDQRISVTKRSINIVKEYRNYLWEINKEGKIINKPEHQFSHCLVGDTKVLMATGRLKMIKNIRPGDKVKTKNGIHKVLKQANTFKNAKIYEIELSNGMKLRGTGNHNIYTNRGKVAIDTLSYYDIIEVLNHKDISLWKKQLYSITKSIDGMVNTTKEKLDYTGQYGSIIMVKSPKDTTYIISIKIGQTMKSLIWKLKRLDSIYRNIQKKCGQQKVLKKKCQTISKILENLQKNGILLKKELSGIKNTERKLGLIEKYSKRNVKFVEKNMKLISPTEADFATTIVKRKRCGREDVYNLTVEKEHNYYADGVLVGNSMDAIRYGLDSYRPRKTVKFKQPNVEMATEYYGGEVLSRGDELLDQVFNENLK